MSKFTRRQFTRLVLGGITLFALNSCAPEEVSRSTATPSPKETSGPAPSPKETPSPTSGVTGTALPAVALTPTPNPTRTILRNENRPGFFVRYYKPFMAVDPASWTLSVEGLVKKPQKLSLSDLQTLLPRVSQVSRMVCVEGWSAAAKWEGFHLSSLLQLVEPLPEAKWVHFYCADDYYESLTLEELLKERILFVYGMNDQPLLDAYGAPLRLIVPDRYGYKGPKAITRLVFAEAELRGYWSTVGPYSTVGRVEPGMDYPLDLGGQARRISGGEVEYSDGIESKQE
jgi:DMSO/TMAO reductase YedYZ molybdopterin-dependent catalytic subunit